MEKRRSSELRWRPIIERLLEGKPLLPILAQKGETEETIQRWREKGYSPEAVKMAVRMANNWLEKVTK